MTLIDVILGQLGYGWHPRSVDEAAMPFCVAVLGKGQSCTKDLLHLLLLGCPDYLHWPHKPRKLETAWEADSSSGRTEHHTSSWPTDCEVFS